MGKYRGILVVLAAAAVLVGLLPGWGAASAGTDSVPVAVLMYHNFAGEDGSYTVSAERFRDHLTALAEAGYVTVTFGDLLAYAAGDGDLPEKPVVLVSDDGYEGVLTYALPVLEEMDMVMSTAVIGELIGVREPGRTGHFSMEELREADPDGRLEPVSHSFGLHSITAEMTGAVNLTLPQEAYAGRLAADCALMAAYGETYPGMGQVFVYPFGGWSAESETLLSQAGYRVTVTTERGIAQVIRGAELTLLPRVPAEWYSTGEALLAEMDALSP